MQDFFSWFRDHESAEPRPWLILGKGPSFEKRSAFDLSQYRLLSLNHAVRDQRVDVAHFIDLDVIDAIGASLRNNTRVVVMPWVPHVQNRAGRSNLRTLAEHHSLLSQLDREGRLLWYNLSTAGTMVEGDSPVVKVRFFSAESALNLLAIAGVTNVRSLGIDGGKNYSNEFADVAANTLLANGRSSFDRQFESIAETISRTGVNFAPLDVESPIRVYVGATPDQRLATRVLEYSIRRHASMTVEVTPLCDLDIEIPTPVNPANRPRTPFSFQRFMIPEAANFRGHAIYLDSDMQVFQDIKQLWLYPMHSAPLLAASEPSATGRRPQFSVMLLDCAELRWSVADVMRRLDAGEFTYEKLMYDMAIVPGLRPDIPDVWNSLERYDERRTALVHYTDMDTQPWLSQQNPLGYLWCRSLLAAIDAQFISIDEVRDGIRIGCLRPSLEAQIAERIEDPLLLPKKIADLDRGFVPPHASLRKATTVWVGAARKLTARIRDRYHRSVLFQLRRRLRDRR